MKKWINIKPIKYVLGFLILLFFYITFSFFSIINIYSNNALRSKLVVTYNFLLNTLDILFSFIYYLYYYFVIYVNFTYVSISIFISIRVL